MRITKYQTTDFIYSKIREKYILSHPHLVKSSPPYDFSITVNNDIKRKIPEEEWKDLVQKVSNICKCENEVVNERHKILIGNPYLPRYHVHEVYLRELPSQLYAKLPTRDCGLIDYIEKNVQEPFKSILAVLFFVPIALLFFCCNVIIFCLMYVYELVVIIVCGVGSGLVIDMYHGRCGDYVLPSEIQYLEENLLNQTKYDTVSIDLDLKTQLKDVVIAFNERCRIRNIKVKASYRYEATTIKGIMYYVDCAYYHSQIISLCMIFV